MSKRGAIDQYFTKLAPSGNNRKKARPDALVCKAAGGQDQEGGDRPPWDDLLVSPRGLSHKQQHSGKQQQQQQQQQQVQADQAQRAEVAAVPPPAAAGAGSAAGGGDGSSRGGNSESAAGTAPAAAPAAPAAAAGPQAGAPPVPNALGAMMAAARTRSKGAAAGGSGAAKGSNKELGLQEMQERAARHQAAASAAVQAAASTGQPLQLRSLLLELSWLDVLGPEFNKPYMQQLQGFLQQEWQQGTIYPPQASIFRAFNSVPFDQVRVVILGQDPYINVGEAMGLSFSVPQGVRVPPSLANIYKELASDVGATVPNHGCLEKWCHQGVLLLNAALTVRAKQSNSHAGKGWEAFTSAALTALAKQRSGIVFLLWGKYAQDRCAKLDMQHHHVLKSVHPSPLSAHRGFLGCRHFSATNQLLQQAGHTPIDWQIDST